MAVTLDPATEQRIQRQLCRGAFTEPARLPGHALDLLEAEEKWLLRNKEKINAALNESFGWAAFGRGYSLEELQAMVAGCQ